MSKKELNLSVVLEKTEVIQYLESLAQSFRAEKVVIQKGSEFLTLLPSSQIEITVEAKQKKDKEKLVIEMSWSTESIEVPADFLKISSTEPEQASVDEPAEEIEG